MTIAAAKERPGFPGYAFGMSDDEVSSTRQELSDLPSTDDKGKATVEIALDKLPDTTRLLEARIIIGMAESGGRAVERKLTLPIAPAAAMIGVKPAFNGRALADGANADFDVVMVAPDGKTVAAKGLRYELLRVETSYQWYRANGQWNYEPVKRTQRVANGTLDADADKPAHLSLPVNWGRYRLEVSTGDANGAVTSLTFDAGYLCRGQRRHAGSAGDRARQARLPAGRDAERGGDRAHRRPPHAQRLHRPPGRQHRAGRQSRHRACDARRSATDWGTGAYVVATLRRPLDAPAQRMPGRAIGVQWFGIDRAAHTLPVSLNLPAMLRPNSKLTVPLRIAGLQAGEEARVVVAAVDVGILNLTNYKPPAPDDYYLGQRQLTAEIRDLYGQLIDGMQGVPGTIRSGGDIGAELAGSPPAQAPLALYSGIVKVGADGAATVSFDIPAFTGTVRVMAVAWSKDKVGKAAGDVIVRDPVVLTATLPRFLRTGDKGAVQLEFDNVEGAAGDFSVTVSGEGAVKLDGDKTQKLTLAAKQRGRLSVPVAASTAGASTISVSVAGPNGFTLERAYALNVRPANQLLTRRTVRSLAAGETLTLGSDMFADFVPGTGRVSLTVALSTSFDAATLLAELDRYPFGCSEQIDQPRHRHALSQRSRRRHQARARRRSTASIRDAIARLLARQDSNGSFGLWAVGGEDVWLDAYVTDFLTRAQGARLRGAGDRLHAGARPPAQLRRAAAGPRQGRRPRARLCALRAGAERRRAGRRPALHRRRQARRAS